MAAPQRKSVAKPVKKKQPSYWCYTWNGQADYVRCFTKGEAIAVVRNRLGLGKVPGSLVLVEKDHKPEGQ